MYTVQKYNYLGLVNEVNMHHTYILSTGGELLGKCLGTSLLAWLAKNGYVASSPALVNVSPRPRLRIYNGLKSLLKDISVSTSARGQILSHPGLELSLFQGSVLTGGECPGTYRELLKNNVLGWKAMEAQGILRILSLGQLESYFVADCLRIGGEPLFQLEDLVLEVENLEFGSAAESLPLPPHWEELSG